MNFSCDMMTVFELYSISIFLSNITLLQLGDYEIAWVDAEVGKTENDMLSLLPISTPAPPHKSVVVGDLKMADFKQFLASKGVKVLLFHIWFNTWLKLNEIILNFLSRA